MYTYEKNRFEDNVWNIIDPRGSKYTEFYSEQEAADYVDFMNGDGRWAQKD